MKNVFSIAPATLAIALTVGMAQTAMADAPTIQTQGAIIYLADNLQEEANLGWCLDTDGREFTELMHAHSCKPNGDDVLFAYAADSNMISSATYANKCVAYNAPENDVNPFGLVDCDASASNQKFVYDADTQEFHLGTDATQCLTVSAVIDEAGPYQSRDLILGSCDDLDPSFKQWVIRG